jgi:drug/metabolite transporter (DMT)-like permease
MTASPPTPPRSYLVGCAQVVIAGLVLSLGVICIRSAARSDAWQYLLWRSLGLALVFTLLAARGSTLHPLAQIARLGGFAWLSVLAMVTSQVCFVAAIKLGNTAEVFFLMSLAPLIAAVLAGPLIGERLGVMGLLAIAVALGGVALMSGLGSDGTRGGLWQGDWLARALALGTATGFALYSIATRGARPEDLDAALLATGIVATLVSAGVLTAQGLPLAASGLDVAIAILHGGVFLAAGLLLFGRGSRVVPGVTLVMLAQAETVAAPIWTYLIFGETTTLAVISGGALILVAVVLQAMDGARRRAATGREAGS